MAALAFGTHMLGSDSQNASFRLHESEIKLLELIRDCVQARVSSDREYSRLLNQSCLKAARYEPVVKTPLAEVWKSVIEKTDALSLKIKDEADHIMNTTCAKLQSLIADRRAAKQLFHEEKNAFENEINKAKAEMNRHYGEYTKAMVKAKQKRVEYDDLNNRGKSSVSKLDDLRRKYSVLTDKLHRIHNDYVLSIREGCAVKDGLVDNLLPMYMSAQQDYCQDSVVQCKSILTEYVRLSDNYNTESSNIHKTMRELVATINPKKEYDEFIKLYQSESKLELPQFDGRIFEGYTGILKPDVITVDDITYEVLDQLKNTYTDRMKNKETDIKAYQAQIKTVKDEIAAVPPTANKSELTPKRRHLKWLERKLKDMNLFKERQQSILDLISKSLAKADTNNLPKAASLDPDDSTSITSEQNGSAAPVPMPRDGFMSKLTKKFNKKPAQDGATSDSHNDSAGGGRGQRPQREEYCVVVPKEGRPVKMTENPNSPLEDEEWFHGILPREEVVRLLKEDGDYLVRESKKRATNESQYVLSVMWQGPKHFIIQTSENGWRLEGTAHNTIQELIIQQHKSDTPVTNKSQAKLTTPIMRETWQVKNDDIRLEEKIGNGNFGEVFRGYFRGGIVAVKTCKEELQEDQKKKFIGEGRILRRYDHPNIVRFVGIAAQKNPVMIVMEYVSGGALLSWLRKNGIAEPKRSLVQMCIDAGSGMEYLESKNVIHRDLAARNCLISDNKIVKISDFGMSREEETYEVSTGMRQIPIKWTAPEALNYGKYTSLCDVWSFGILMWEIFSAGKTPYPGMKNQEARDRVDQGYRMPSPDNCPNAVYSLMRDCWEEKPEKRPHFDRIVRELGHAQSEIVR